jgi:hypothetical protein
MKKQLFILSLITAFSFSALGQGYMTFSASKSVYYGPTVTLGVGTNNGAAFLWAPIGTFNPLGAGIATNAAITDGSAWNVINAMTSSGGWTLGLDFNNSNAQAIGTVPPSGVGAGNIMYNGGAPFQLAGSTAGATYQMIALAWSGGTYGTSTTFGWSSAFNYQTGVSPADTASVVNFTGNGMSPFGVAPTIPEPSTIALTGLAGLTLLALRRN